MNRKNFHDRKVIDLYLGRESGLDDSEITDILYPTSDAQGRRHWQRFREAVIAEWVAAHPGARPWAEWKYSLPELSRRRLGGSGTPMLPPEGEWQVNGGLAAFGAPLYWHDVDPADPPVYESQAAYLQRRGLLTAEEQKRLSTEAYKPVSLGPEWYLKRECLPFYEEDFSELPPCLR